ncbi:MAG: 5-oxoprolinase [Alphaproteobacteria bacterium]|nr:MAG: 5-oxoprolinase [Alphaproteobacteria bacterium]
MRFAADTGGTFTDLIVEYDDGNIKMFKAPTTPSNPVQGVLDALANAAKDSGISLHKFLRQADCFIHGTTHAINAIITGNTAKTAFLTTKGHPDILLMREGGRTEPFNHSVAYPDAYIPRSLTWEIPERINYAGDVIEPLNEEAVIDVIQKMKGQHVEAVAVCLLWSISNPDHELRIQALLNKHLPDVPVTLSHKLNPTLREYRRASSACIDASLKPLMGQYLGSLMKKMEAAGFSGKLFVVSSQGGMMEASSLAEAPIHAINSGPSLAPLAGSYYAQLEHQYEAVIVADTGGTTYDVSLVRQGHIPMSREMWIGEPYRGHMTGFPSVDVKSIGAGGGSIAWVDGGGMLHVGPKSAGAEPGPACYGHGGLEPTLTDACLVLGYLDPDYFLGGSMKINIALSREAISSRVAEPLGISLEEAAWSIMDLATENMTQAIVDITVNQGIDATQAVLIGGGGAAGLNSTFIAQRLGCKQLIIPEVGAALSAAGELMSDLSMEYRSTYFSSTENFDIKRANVVLADLRSRCEDFIKKAGQHSKQHSIVYKVEARYPSQVWEIEVDLPFEQFSSDEDVVSLRQNFHDTHQRIFAIQDSESHVECVTWSATVRCKMNQRDGLGRVIHDNEGRKTKTRQIYFANYGAVDARIESIHQLTIDEKYKGPAVIESPFTTVVIDPGSHYSRSANGSLVIEPFGA